MKVFILLLVALGCLSQIVSLCHSSPTFYVWAGVLTRMSCLCFRKLVVPLEVKFSVITAGMESIPQEWTVILVEWTSLSTAQWKVGHLLTIIGDMPPQIVMGHSLWDKFLRYKFSPKTADFNWFISYFGCDRQLLLEHLISLERVTWATLFWHHCTKMVM